MRLLLELDTRNLDCSLGALKWSEKLLAAVLGSSEKLLAAVLGSSEKLCEVSLDPGLEVPLDVLNEPSDN